MLQELQILLHFNLSRLETVMLFSFRKNIEVPMECFMLDMTGGCQLQASLSKQKAEELVSYLQGYIKEMELDND